MGFERDPNPTLEEIPIDLQKAPRIPLSFNSPQYTLSTPYCLGVQLNFLLLLILCLETSTNLQC